MSYFAKIRVITMKKLTETILNLVFPPKCPFCGKVLDAVGVCPPCEKALPWIPEEQAVLSEGDLTCAAPLWYEGNVREALLRLKFRGGSALAEPLGELLAQCAAEQFGGEFDTVTWVPVSRKRLKRRGYDQSRLLAASLCRRAHLYLWDEPLNYIDLLSRQQLEQLLLEFAPTMVFVEHDELFCRNVATEMVPL